MDETAGPYFDPIPSRKWPVRLNPGDN